jgi:hypothetical protein
VAAKPKGKALVAYDQPKIMALICERMAEGKSLREICEQEGMPAKTNVLKWLDADESGVLRDQYARGRQALADFYADEIVTIADTAEDPQKGRLQVDARKWVVSKLFPKRYGDKVEHEHAGANGGPILIATGVIRAGD